MTNTVVQARYGPDLFAFHQETIARLRKERNQLQKRRFDEDLIIARAIRFSNLVVSDGMPVGVYSEAKRMLHRAVEAYERTPEELT
jgi:hypothetical protein